MSRGDSRPPRPPCSAGIDQSALEWPPGTARCNVGTFDVGFQVPFAHPVLAPRAFEHATRHRLRALHLLELRLPRNFAMYLEEMTVVPIPPDFCSTDPAANAVLSQDEPLFLDVERRKHKPSREFQFSCIITSASTGEGCLDCRTAGTFASRIPFQRPPFCFALTSIALRPRGKPAVWVSPPPGPDRPARRAVLPGYRRPGSGATKRERSY